jgi:hypothetical protein
MPEEHLKINLSPESGTEKLIFTLKDPRRKILIFYKSKAPLQCQTDFKSGSMIIRCGSIRSRLFIIDSDRPAEFHTANHPVSLSLKK